MSKEAKKLLSIIIVTYNAEDSIKKTLQSLENQKNIDWESIEILFIDGASTDKTFENIKNNLSFFENSKATIKIVSEPDKGIYDAMNKGICLSTSKWVYMFNAGDVFYSDNTLSDLWSVLSDSNACVLYGNYCRVNDHMEDYMKIRPLEQVKTDMIFCHQAIFVNGEYAKSHLFNLNYKLTADYDFLLNAFVNGEKFEYVDEFIVKYDLTGLSAVKMIDSYKEHYKVRKDCLKISISSKDRFLYVVGLIKRMILTYMPQKLRWKLFALVKGMKK